MTEITEEQIDILHTPVVEKDETEFAPLTGHVPEQRD